MHKNFFGLAETPAAAHGLVIGFVAVGYTNKGHIPTILPVGKFSVKALNPTTLAAYSNLALETDYTE